MINDFNFFKLENWYVEKAMKLIKEELSDKQKT